MAREISPGEIVQQFDCCQTCPGWLWRFHYLEIIKLDFQLRQMNQIGALLLVEIHRDTALINGIFYYVDSQVYGNNKPISMCLYGIRCCKRHKRALSVSKMWISDHECSSLECLVLITWVHDWLTGSLILLTGSLYFLQFHLLLPDSVSVVEREPERFQHFSFL